MKKKNNLNILKIDLDLETLNDVFVILNERLSYMNDIGFLYFNKIKKIETIYKTRYSVKIYLKFNLKNLNNVVLFEALLGNGYRKGINTLINHHKLNMNYSNRMFDIKRYPDGTYIQAKKKDITKEIKLYINDKSRKVWRN